MFKQNGACRMCSGADNILAFPSNFIDNLLGTSSRQWTQQIEHHEIDIFSHNMIIMPFHSHGQKSLFVVFGAKHIKDYMKRDVGDTRPCILQILPYAKSMQCQTHAYTHACLRLRAWLNALWRTTCCNNDFDSMPFTHRSLPMTRPFGECIEII